MGNNLTGSLSLAPMGDKWAVTFFPNQKNLDGVGLYMTLDKLLECLKELGIEQEDVVKVETFDLEQDARLFEFEVNAPIESLRRYSLIPGNHLPELPKSKRRLY